MQAHPSCNSHLPCCSNNLRQVGLQHAALLSGRTRAQEKTCPNPYYYPQKPYVDTHGCWYEKDSEDGFLSGEAPACDQGGRSDPAAPAPLSGDNKPAATCALAYPIWGFLCAQRMHQTHLDAVCPAAWQPPPVQRVCACAAF